MAHHDLVRCPGCAGVQQCRAARIGVSLDGGLTRQAYELGLRQFAGWCQQLLLHVVRARRADIELFARDVGARDRARATITRRPCTVAGFCR